MILTLFFNIFELLNFKNPAFPLCYASQVNLQHSLGLGDRQAWFIPDLATY